MIYLCALHKRSYLPETHVFRFSRFHRPEHWRRRPTQRHDPTHSWRWHTISHDPSRTDTVSTHGKPDPAPATDDAVIRIDGLYGGVTFAPTSSPAIGVVLVVLLSTNFLFHV